MNYKKSALIITSLLMTSSNVLPVWPPKKTPNDQKQNPALNTGRGVDKRKTNKNDNAIIYDSWTPTNHSNHHHPHHNDHHHDNNHDSGSHDHGNDGGCDGND